MAAVVKARGHGGLVTDGLGLAPSGAVEGTRRVQVPPAVAGPAADIVREELATAGLALNEDKTKAWTRDLGTRLPTALEARRVQELTVLGGIQINRAKGGDRFMCAPAPPAPAAAPTEPNGLLRLLILPEQPERD